jgi:hypothetical protein
MRKQFYCRLRQDVDLLSHVAFAEHFTVKRSSFSARSLLNQCQYFDLWTRLSHCRLSWEAKIYNFIHVLTIRSGLST